MATGMGESRSDAAILSRLIFPEADHLSLEAARGWLAIRFDPTDLDRIQELVAKNQREQLTDYEQVELEDYRRVSYLLDLMHSKARRALKDRPASG